MLTKLLLVDDDNQPNMLLRSSLREAGYLLECVCDETKVQDAVSRNKYALLILQSQLPRTDGSFVCQRLRARGCTLPILVLSRRMDVAKQVRCLDSGADDYLTVPYDLRVLLARVRVLIRRGASACVTARVGPLMLDRLDRCAKLDGRAVILSPREYSVLDYLVHEVGRAVPRAELLNKAWHIEDNGGSNVVDAHVKKLRKKLHKHAKLIETVRGVGYRIKGGGSSLSN